MGRAFPIGLVLLTATQTTWTQQPRTHERTRAGARACALGLRRFSCAAAGAADHFGRSGAGRDHPRRRDRPGHQMCARAALGYRSRRRAESSAALVR